MAESGKASGPSASSVGLDGGVQAHAKSSSLSSSSRHSQSDEKSPQRDSRQSHRSRASDDSDPLAPLELAISPGYGVDDEDYDRTAIGRIRTTTSIGSSASRPPDYEVVFDEGDPENPRNWSVAYRAWMTFCISFTTWVVVLYSTSYTAAINGVKEEFGIQSTTIVTLGVTAYLVGLAAGSLLVAPASELWGRRPVYIICMIIFTLLVIPSCLATSLAEIIIVRFFG
jgi:hypothetical protein